MPPRLRRKPSKPAAPVVVTPEQALAELARQDREDPVRAYKPGPTCARCARSTSLYRLVNGGNQVGKTNHAVWETAAMLRGIHPHKPWFGPVKMLCIVPTRQQAVAVWGKRLLEACEMLGEIGKFPYIPASEIAQIFWNYSASGKAPGRILLKNGSDILFAWAGDSTMWESIQGIKFDYVVRDESVGNNKLSPEIFVRLMAARTDPAKPWAGGILWNGTPTLDNEEYEDFQRRCREGKPDYEEFFIAANENPAVSMAVRESLRDSMSADEQAVRLDGGTSAVEALRIFRNQWRDERHLAAVDYEPELTDNLWVSFDPGIGHEAGILCAAVNRDTPRTIRVVRFYCHKNMPLSYHIQCMADWLDGRALEGLVVDPKAFARESSGKSIVTQIEEALASDMPPFRCWQGVLRGRNGHWEGINQVREYLDPVPGNPLVQPLVIVNQLSPGCGLFRHQMTSYKGREETKYTGPHGVQKKRDEAPDCLRYLITKEPYYEDRGPNPRRAMGQVQARADDLSELSLAGLPPDLRRHHEQIQRSIRMVEEMTGDDGGREMGTGRLAWA